MFRVFKQTFILKKTLTKLFFKMLQNTHNFFFSNPRSMIITKRKCLMKSLNLKNRLQNYFLKRGYINIQEAQISSYFQSCKYFKNGEKIIIFHYKNKILFLFLPLRNIGCLFSIITKKHKPDIYIYIKHQKYMLSYPLWNIPESIVCLMKKYGSSKTTEGYLPFM